MRPLYEAACGLVMSIPVLWGLALWLGPAATPARALLLISVALAAVSILLFSVRRVRVK